MLLFTLGIADKITSEYLHCLSDFKNFKELKLEILDCKFSDSFIFKI